MLILLLSITATQVTAQEPDDLITFTLSYDLPEETSSGDCIVSVAIHIDKGFPLSGKRFAVEQLLIIYRELWGEEDGHTDVTQSVVPSKIPQQINTVLGSFDGAELVMMLFDAFNSVEDQGVLYFDEPVDLVYAETLPFYPDIPMEMLNKELGNGQGGKVEFVLDKIYDDEDSKRIINGNLVNISAAILSYRSEHLVFPLDLGEVEITGHLLVNLFNPYSGLPVRSISDDLSVRPGDVRYDYYGPDKVSIVSFLADGTPVKRDISLYSSSEFNTLFKKTTGLSEEDRRVCIYTFQLAHIINEFYHSEGYLPDKVPQIESKLFATVSFLNPYTREPVKQIMNPLEKREGDYFYYKTGESQYLLVGYGYNLHEVMKIQRDLSESPKG